MTAPKAIGYIILKQTAKEKARKRAPKLIAIATTKAKAMKKLDELSQKAPQGTRFTVSHVKAVRARTVK